MDKIKKYNQCDKLEQCRICNSYDVCLAWVKFVSIHNETKTYAHFDKRVSLMMPSIRKYVMNEKNIAKHSFYPFIHFKKKNSRYGKKGPKKPRELFYCSHLDRCVYQRYAFLINQTYNKWVEQNDINNVAIAYRDNLNKNNINFAKDAFESIRKTKDCLIIIGDFTDFFDKINHIYLKKMLSILLGVEKLPADYYAIFKNITHFAFWEWTALVTDSGHRMEERGLRKKINSQDTILTKEQFEKYKDHINKNIKDVGIPQGSPISAVLSNVYMMHFDKFINTYVKENNGIYMRYSDDFIIVLPYKTSDEILKYVDFVFSYISSMKGLIDLQQEKTVIYIYDGNRTLTYPTNEPCYINYLGFLFNGRDVKLRPKAITKYYYRMRRKARTIGKSNWKTSKGKHISAKNLYSIYSSNDKNQTFIDFAKNAKSILNLNDSEVDSLIKNHKHKISEAIKRGKLD